MFICQPCLDAHYKNHESMSKSKGKCEICNNLNVVCNDITSKFLVKKEPIDPRTGLPIVNKTIRVTVEVSESFVKLLRANIELGNLKEKIEYNKADPCQMLGVLVYHEARGSYENEIDMILPPTRRDEIQVIHSAREVLVNGVPANKFSSG